MTTRYYDKDGSPMELFEWGRKFEDMEYKRVAATTLEDGTLVSTVWLGLNHQYGDGPPLIFETMVFPSKDSPYEEDQDRYSTLEEAIARHEQMVGRWKEKEANNGDRS